MNATALGLETWHAAFARQRRQRADSRWLTALREGAMSRFERSGFPKPRDEAWRQTSVAEIARAAFVEADPGLRLGAVGPTVQRLGIGGAFAGRQAVFVNGVFAADLSSWSVSGVELRSLRELLREDPERLSDLLGGAAAAHPFADLNTALFPDAACLFLAPGARPEGPLHLLFLTTSGGEVAAVASFPRTLVVAGRGSQATLVESYGGPNGESYLTSAVSDLLLDEGAVLRRVKLQRESLKGSHVALVRATLARDAHLEDFNLATGAALGRNDIEVRLDGPGADCTLDGLFVADGGQLLDTHSLIDHAAPHGTSRQLYKGVLGGRSRGVFHGRVLVRAGAQKTDAQQANRNLLLSSEALVHSMPQLEILADDVKCKHGSTTGQLDPTQLFYLRSRGIGEQAAKSLLTYAFAADVVARVPVPPVRQALESFLRDRLPQAPAEPVA
jgi:Fe-S cluster assembly protein SufD